MGTKDQWETPTISNLDISQDTLAGNTVGPVDASTCGS